MSELLLDRVSFAVGQRAKQPLVEEISLTVPSGEVLVLIGPSGSGKSTLLRLIAGLEEPSSGEIRLDGRRIHQTPPQERDIAMVFQGYALYPQMTARGNIEFPLRMRRAPPERRAAAVQEAAALVGITRLLDRYPDQMSGGERQRVAIARALVRRPKVFLFDEPLSNLDAALRAELRVELSALFRRLRATVLYVTHDQAEAMTLGHRVAILRGGKLLQIGTPRELYERPKDSFVGTFLGHPAMSLLSGQLNNGSLRVADWVVPVSSSASGEVHVGVRSEDLTVSLGEDGPGLLAEVRAIEPLGAESILLLQLKTKAGPDTEKKNAPTGGEQGGELRARVPGFTSLRVGELVRARLDATKVHLFDPQREGVRLS